MHKRIRFHFDENVPAPVADALKRRGVDVTTTHDSNLLQSKDEYQLLFAKEEGRILVTHDSDFLRLHDNGFPHAGIAYCQQGSRTIGEMIKSLLLILELMSLEEMENNVEYL